VGADQEHMRRKPCLTSYPFSGWLAAAILLMFAASLEHPNRAFGNDYHNSTKRFTPPSEMSEADWSDPAELQRTWNAALVRIPLGSSKILKSHMHQLNDSEIPPEKKFPTVIYLHGCSGVWEGTYKRIDFLASNGFAVIAPISFARKKYPKSCDTQKHTGGLYRPTLRMRQNDASYAIQMAKRLSWVSSKNVFLMGLSQGGIATATFTPKVPAEAVRARVVEGWTCHAGWKEYRGINAPDTEPVLTLVGEQDPWFQKPVSRGDCGEFLRRNNGSKSVVYRTGRLRSRHELLESKSVQEVVLEFLRKHTRR
jgi:hypothetical protein